MSRFQTIGVNVAGGTSKNRSKALNSQSTINFYPEVSEGGREQFVLQSFPGLTDYKGSKTPFFGAGVDTDDKGMHRMKEVLYRVVGDFLYQVLEDGTTITVGNINFGINTILGKCIFADDGVNLFIQFQNSLGQYIVRTFDSSIPINPLINNTIEVTDPNIIGSESVCFLNNQFIYTKGKFFTVSDVGNGAVASGLNTAGAESLPDDIVRGYSFRQLLFLFGERSTEIHFNSGVGSPPFERIEGKIFTVGLGAKHSVANNDNFMYWVGDDRKIYRSNGGLNENVSNNSIVHDLESFDKFDDGIGFTFSFENQNFYAITFKDAGTTWCLNESLGKNGWFKLSSMINFAEDEKIHGIYTAFSAIECYNEILMPLAISSTVSNNTSRLMFLDINGFMNYDQNILRERTMSTISSDILGVKGERMQMSKFKLILEKGVGLISGQGVDPKIMIEASYDSGKTFGAGTWMKIGRMGENTVQAEWHSMKSFHDLTIRITTSDPVFYSIHAGAIDVRLVGGF